MPKVNVDEAFEWLMVIIGIVFAILSQYPELYWTGSENLPSSIQAARQLVLPLLVIAFLWLAGKLVINENTQVAIKLIAWMIALALAIMNIFTWGFGSGYVTDQPITEFIAIIFGFIVNPIFVYGIIVPRYKEIYPNSTFLQSKIKLLLVYIILLLFVAVTVLISSILD